MFSGSTYITGVLVTAIAVFAGGTAVADPSQDDKFLTLLGYEDIPAIDNATSLIDTAHKVCGKLDDGMPAGDLVELIRNNGFNENPLARFYPQRRVTKTINRFIDAAVQAYCPYDQGKIASLTVHAVPASNGPTRPVAAYTRNSEAPSLVLGIGTFPSGEIPPSNPPVIPAEPPPVPHEVAPDPRQSPPQAELPSRRAKPPPQEAAPAQEPAPAQGPAPAQEPGPPQAGPPAAGPPLDDGGGAPASPPPEPASPEQPAPPGHVRLAP